ncbi:hypothetical protein GY14_02695 [Delftia tsuruhatensis]|jgi:hypothetical protein|uniref:Uncharacterized protein n=2 Tax=Delftia TaxID=80865 RepID=A0ABM6E2V3_9BURK|nr:MULTISPECIES: hypothetical protein [Delftia]AOV01666.1 hypothetical protein BI380_10030 [Delftia tsuruhatensis]KEH10807.1 hypothetical protein GY14_02695 [Delftia tsuruhatensis]MDX4957944.1 hypothetical protein [Delftia acidovorans]
MNAYELFDAAFDSANDHRESTAAYVKQYADGAFDLVISDEVAEAIAAAKRKFDANGDGSNDFYHMVRAPLEEIEL